MEFKLNGTAEEALQQINNKRYALPFEADGRKLFKIGINFSEKTRNIEKWVVASRSIPCLDKETVIINVVILFQSRPRFC